MDLQGRRHQERLERRYGPPLSTLPLAARPSGNACTVHFDGRDLAFDHCAQLNDFMQIYWTIQTYRVETVVYSRRRKGWIGVGWGYTAMEGSNAVVAYKEAYSNTAQIGDYHLAFKASDGVSPEGFQDLRIQRATTSSHHLAMMFARPLGRIRAHNIPSLNESSRVPLIWAYGDSADFMGTLSKHTAAGWTYVDFGTAKNYLQAGGNSYMHSKWGAGISNHVNIMGFTWIFLIPLAIVFIKCKARPKLAYTLHKGMNTLGVTLTFFGFFVGVINGSHTYTAHMALGWGVFALTLLQPFGLLWKHKFDSAWRIVHKSLGRVAAILAVLNVYIGMYIYGSSIASYMTVSLIFAGFAAVAAAFAYGMERRFIDTEEEIERAKTHIHKESYLLPEDDDEETGNPENNNDDDDGNNEAENA